MLAAAILNLTNMSSGAFQTTTKCSSFSFSPKIKPKLAEKELLHINFVFLRDTNITFKLKTLQVNHLRENQSLDVENTS